MSDTAGSQQAPSFSIGRVLVLAVPLALITWGAYKMYGGNVQQNADAQLQRNALSGLLGPDDAARTLAKRYVDANDDLLADAPKEADKLLDPDTLRFSYVASSETEGEQETWKELLAAIGQRTGKSVELVSYADTDEQLRALRDGDLHITAFSTGEAPGAVNEAGFVPLVCAADQNGDYSITMKIIVPADSEIEKIDDLRPVDTNGELKKRRITFVRPRSNSGCTAALVMLMDKHNLQPERDYTWGFSYGHDNSIGGVAEKRFEAAAVASDILARMIADGDVAADAVREIYESEPFPPGVIGVAYNLKPELGDKIRAALAEFAWAGTGVEKEFGPQGAVKFAPVNYKDDWETIRDIRATGSAMLAQLGTN